ncbi:MAG TPA: dephospho-CoA kinase [Thermoleophilaceae bacterium]
MRSRPKRSARPRPRFSRTPSRLRPTIPSRQKKTPRTPFVGLTGGIGAGKSEALKAFERLGAATLSTDQVTHELLATGEVRDLLVAELGPEVAPNGQIDRTAVASRVFGDDEKRQWLESVLWPRVGERVASFRETSEDRPAAVVEVPLLFESGMEAVFDKTIAVVADEAVRSGRAAARGHELVEARTARQLSQDEKAQRADFVVRNDGTVEELEIKLSGVLAKLREDGHS